MDYRNITTANTFVIRFRFSIFVLFRSIFTQFYLSAVASQNNFFIPPLFLCSSPPNFFYNLSISSFRLNWLAYTVVDSGNLPSIRSLFTQLIFRYFASASSFSPVYVCIVWKLIYFYWEKIFRLHLKQNIFSECDRAQSTQHMASKTNDVWWSRLDGNPYNIVSKCVDGAPSFSNLA